MRSIGDKEAEEEFLNERVRQRDTLLFVQDLMTTPG